MSASRLVALTMGEPAGIGGEIALKAWQEAPDPFVILDCLERLEALAKRCGLRVPCRSVDSAGAAEAVFSEALPVWPLAQTVAGEPGSPCSADGAAVLESIERAVALAQEGVVRGVVTNPVNKRYLMTSGFTHPGHTEFLGALCKVGRPVMMLESPSLGFRVVPLTTHMALREACGALRQQDIEAVARVVLAHLARRGFVRPQLVVSGLNPHAGEGGHMGDEDARIIAPAVAVLRAEGHRVRGPLPADTLFHEKARQGYDAALCMTHDQALIPIKTLDFAGTVNITLNLPIVRTSPDHGTAEDIAGQGVASCQSLVEALALAHRLG